MKKIKVVFLSFCMAVMGIAPIIVNAEDCKGIQLNTNVPFVGNCITINSDNGASDQDTTPINAFPKLMGAMMNLLMTVIMVMSLLLIVYAGVLMTMEGAPVQQSQKGMDIIKKVATGMALLGASGVILKVINPNFFT